MLKGYMGKILFVDLSNGDIVEEMPDEQLFRDFLGGYGVGAKVLFSRQKPGVDPLSSDNILGFVTGLLTGTPTPLGCRYVVVAKSPLTGTWGDANSGGDFGPYIKFSGYDAIFFTGVSKKPVYLSLHEGKAELRDASSIWGKDTYQTEDMIKAELGKETRVACIGQSGEAQSLISCIINNKGRAAARSGLGAVMGSKKLKAIAAYGTLQVPIADVDEVNRLRKKYLATLGNSKFADRLKTNGTFSGLADAARGGEAPIKNWGGIGIIDFPEAEAVDADVVLALRERGYACWHCPIGCGGHMKEGKEYTYMSGTHKPEYETAAAFGHMCLNANVESIIMANDICNRYGLDTISTGAAIAFAIECYENGLISDKDTDGIELKWGNHQAIVTMTQKIADRDGFGTVLADGVKLAAERIGKGSDKYAIHIGGQELPYHDPKNSSRFAVSYKIDATPARHTQAGADSGSGKDQKERNTFCQAYNSAGMCMWGNVIFGADAISEFMSAVTGYPYSVSALLEAGERISNMRQAFNIREGLNPTEREVPDRVLGIPPQQKGPVAGVTVDLNPRVKDYLKAMDWDQETAKPTKKKLQELGLEEVSTVLWPE